MALQKQNVPIVFGKGIDTHNEEKVVQIDKMLELENAVFTKKNTFFTRYGSDLLSNKIVATNDEITDVKKLITFKDELLAATKSNLYSYLSTNNAWADRGSISSVNISSKSIARNNYSQSIPDAYTLNNITVYAWEEGNAVKIAVIDESTNLPILTNYVASSLASKPKVIANNSYIFVYYLETNNLVMRKINTETPGYVSGPTTIATNVVNNFDFAPHGNNIVFIYNNTAGTCTIGYIAPSGLIGTGLSGFPSAVNTALNGGSSLTIVSKFVGEFTDAIYCFYANPVNGLTVSALNLDLTTIYTSNVDPTASIIRNVTAVMQDSVNCKVYYEIYNAVPTNTYVKTSYVSFGGYVDTPLVSVKSVGLITKAFHGDDGNIYVGCGYGSDLQATTFIMKETNINEKLQVAAVVAKYEAGGLTAKDSSLANVSQNRFPNLVKTQLLSESGKVYSLLGIQSTTVDYSTDHLYLFKELGQNTHIAGGVLYDYDGVSAVEHNFHFFPEIVTAGLPTGGGNIESGTRQYCFCYEWTDNQGQIHRSAPSIPIQVTNGALEFNTLSVSTLRVTKKCEASGRADIRIVGYRTKDAQTTFYRFTSQIGTSNLNDTTVDSITILDNISDANIGARDVLYTTGGVLENYAPGACRVVDEYRNRLIVAGCEDQNIVRYTKEKEVNTSADFAEELYFRADSGTNGVQGIAKLDEKLLIFKESEIYYQIGQGPTATGALDDYQQPIFITTDVGTTEPQSIINMPLGIIFKSNKGYYLLSRGLEPIYIGEEVEKYNDLKVTSGILCDSVNEVRFTHSDGVTLTYNYNQNQWSVFTNKEAISAVLWQNKWTVLKESGAIYVENVDSYFDGPTPVTKKITTAWIQAASIQGAQRIYRVLLIGKLKSAHRLKIELAYDFDPSIRETFYYDTDTILGSSYYGEGYYGEGYYGGADPVYQVEIRPGIQKCQAIRFTIQDLNDDDINGAGFELTGMTIQVGIKQGLFRPAMTKRVGPST